MPGQVIRVEFPAQGYVNPINTTFEFDVSLQGYGTAGSQCVRFQNNIQSIFNRVRLLYGATPLEDIIQYNVVVRALTEWTSTNQLGTIDQTSIAEGIGGVTVGLGGTGLGYSTALLATAGGSTLVNVRQAYIHGIDATATTNFGSVPNTQGAVGSTTGLPIRRYQVNLALGLLTQDKLIPVKFMASQLAIELSLAPEVECIIATTAGTGNGPTYQVTNFNMIPEILEFDASYGKWLLLTPLIDAMFLKGLQDGGVPIKFSSWHTFIFSTASAANVNLLVQERSRSVKALFAVQRRSPGSYFADHGALFFSTSATSVLAHTMQNYQFRIGGRYFPAQPVQLSTTIGSAYSNGGAEAYVELQKALNMVGDYRLSTGANVLRWAASDTTLNAASTSFATTGENETDYAYYPIKRATAGYPTYQGAVLPGAGNVGSVCYASAVDLETSNGVEISGLNAEEQSDIAFIANWSAAQAQYNLEVYSYYDAMIILRANNVLELIQ